MALNLESDLRSTHEIYLLGRCGLKLNLKTAANPPSGLHVRLHVLLQRVVYLHVPLVPAAVPLLDPPGMLF